MNSSSLLVAKKSATAIPKPSPMREARPNATTELGDLLAPMAETAIIRVVHNPSSPP